MNITDNLERAGDSGKMLSMAEEASVERITARLASACSPGDGSRHGTSRISRHASSSADQAAAQQESRSAFGAIRFVTEISLDELDRADRILIQTANHTYTFCVHNPAQRTGILMSSSITGDLVEALLIGSKGDALRLKAGSQAFFYIESGGGLRRLITSKITDLVCVKSSRKIAGVA